MQRELTTPLILAPGTYRDTEFVLRLASFQPSTVGAAIYGPKGLRRAVLRNCTLRTDATRYDPAWATDPMLRMLAGVRLDAPRELVIDGLEIAGFPEVGLAASGVDTAKIERVSVERCWMGGSFGWVGQANRNLRLRGWRVRDTWGPGPSVVAGMGGSPSRLRPGGWSGGDGIAGYFEDAQLVDLDFAGELYAGIKLVRSKRVCLADVLTNHLMIQGTQDEDTNRDGTSDGSESITVRRLLVDKRRGAGELSERGNGVQVSRHVHGLDVEDFSILAGGTDGHAIQLWRDCEASFRGGLISGFNGRRGTAPAHALELGDGSRVNADFETANRFYDQARLISAP